MSAASATFNCGGCAKSQIYTAPGVAFVYSVIEPPILLVPGMREQPRQETRDDSSAHRSHACAAGEGSMSEKSNTAFVYWDDLAQESAAYRPRYYGFAAIDGKQYRISPVISIPALRNDGCA
jgi:hypothetical protein